MDRKDPSDTNSGDFGSLFKRFREPDEDTTDTIDLTSLIPPDLNDPSNYDQRRVKRAALDKLLEALSVPTLLVARSHTIQFANEAYTKISNEPFDPIGLKFSSLFPNPRKARGSQVLLERVLELRQPEIRETELRIHKTNIWGRLHLRTIKVADVRLVLVQIENLTAQKELLTIQKYKRLVQILPLGIAEFNLRRPVARNQEMSELRNAVQNARVVDCNLEFAAMYGIKNVSTLLKAPLFKLLPYQGRGKDIYDDWIQDGFLARSFDSKEINQAKTVKRFENTLIGNVIDGRLLGFWWLKRDISEKKRMENEILKAQKLESLGILAGGIAHDFNNVLTAILGNISLLRLTTNPGDKAAQRIEATASAAARAQALTRRLLTFSKGGQPIMATVSIAEVLAECCSLVLKGSRVRWVLNLPHDLWPVRVDADQISQVVNNMLINAVQAMPEGGEVQVSASNVAVSDMKPVSLEDGQYVMVSVRDNGLGIRGKHIRKIFDPYFSTKEKGTGLGLATSYSIIKKHGGTINVDSKHGVGSTFYFYLQACPMERRLFEQSDIRPQQGKRSILLMDDEKCIRDLAGDLLTELGYEVAFAKDGTEAIEIYKRAMEAGHTFDVVIMDLTIPGGMGGKETIQIMLEVDPDAKVIVSSGYFNDPIMARHAEYGFSGVLPKPYDAKKLNDALEDILTAKPT